MAFNDLLTHLDRVLAPARSDATGGVLQTQDAVIIDHAQFRQITGWPAPENSGTWKWDRHTVNRMAWLVAQLRHGRYYAVCNAFVDPENPTELEVYLIVATSLAAFRQAAETLHQTVERVSGHEILPRIEYDHKNEPHPGPLRTPSPEEIAALRQKGKPNG